MVNPPLIGLAETTCPEVFTTNRLELLNLNVPDFTLALHPSNKSISEFQESTFPSYVFTKHLQHAKNEEQALQTLFNEVQGNSHLGVDISELRNEVITDAGSKSNLINTESLERVLLSQSQPSELNISNRVSLHEVISNPKTNYFGKYILCFNVTLPVLSHHGEIYILNTILEEPSSKKFVRLEVACGVKRAEIYLNLLRHPYLNNLEPGAAIIIQDPIFTHEITDQGLFTLQVDKAANVEFLPRIFQSLAQEFVKTHQPNLLRDDGSTMLEPLSSISSIDGTVEAKLAADEWRRWGNEYSVGRLHTNALFAYDVVLRFDPENVDAVAGRSAALINLGLYSAARKDVEFLANNDPFNTGFILRKVNCLWGLEKYEETIEYLKSLLTALALPSLLSVENKCGDISRKSLFIEKIVAKTKKIMLQKDGFGSIDMYKFFASNTKLFYDEPEYYNPIKSVTLNIDATKSKTLIVAKRLVGSGELIALTKAFSVIFLDDRSKFFVDRNDELANASLQKILLDQPTEKSFHKEDFNCRKTELDEVTKTDKIMELSNEQAKKLCESLFYAGPSSTLFEGTNSRLRSFKMIGGIWTFPMQIKHACVGGNAVWCTCGNVMFIRAIRDISEGEEIVMAHIEPTESYETRTDVLEARGLQCACPLCEFEKGEAENIKMKRIHLCREMRRSGFLSNDIDVDFSHRDVKNLIRYIDDLYVLRSAYAKLNFPIVDPLILLGNYWISVQNYDQAILALEKAFVILDNTSAIFDLINVSLHLAYCYIARKKNRDKGKAKKWFNATKLYAMFSFGCMEPIKDHFKTEISYLERKGISCLKVNAK